MKPLVSVLMTAYNRQDYIAEAIQSVLDSSYRNFELIICDDCSADDTVNIARSFEKKDPRVKVYVNVSRLGQFHNRNQCSIYAGGKYLKYLDSDDMILKDGLAYCVNEMEKYPDAALGIYNLHAGDAGVTFCMQPAESMQRHFFKEDLLFSGPSGIIIRRDIFESTGRFDTRFGVPSDSFFNIRMAALYPVVMLAQPFYTYRKHEGQELNNYRDYMVYGYLYFRELLTNVALPMSSKQIDYLYRKMDKRHAITLLRYWWRTKNFSELKKLMKETAFTPGKLVLSLFN